MRDSDRTLWQTVMDTVGRESLEFGPYFAFQVRHDDDLKKLQEKGVEIISCGTCLDYFGLKEKLLVGEISNMYTIYETLFNAGKVINI